MTSGSPRPRAHEGGRGERGTRDAQWSGRGETRGGRGRSGETGGPGGGREGDGGRAEGGGEEQEARGGGSGRLRRQTRTLNYGHCQPSTPAKPPLFALFAAGAVLAVHNRRGNRAWETGRPSAAREQGRSAGAEGVAPPGG